MEDSFIFDKTSNTLPKYRFQLLNTLTNELLTLRTAPIEWKEGIIEIKRDIKVGGVFTSFVASSLTFIKEGRDFLNKIWEEKGFNGECELIISWKKFSTRSYVEMPTRFGLNFATAKPRVKVGKFGIGFLVDTQKSSTLVKLENRRGKEVDLTKLVSLGGFPIFNDSSLMKRLLSFASADVRLSTIWTANYNPASSFKIENNKNKNIFTQFQMILSMNDFDESFAVNYQTNIDNRNEVDYCYKISKEPREITFDYKVSINVTNNKTGWEDRNVYAVLVEVLNGNVIKYSERILDCGRNKGIQTAKGTIELSLEIGDNIRVYIQSDDTDNIAANIHESRFWINQKVLVSPTKELDSFPIYNAFERVLQHITDLQFPFFSDFFGNTDMIYNTNGDKYLTENQISFANLMTGLNLRGASLFDENNPLPVSFDKLFHTANCIWNLGYSNEMIDNFSRIRIEPYSWFFDNSEALDLSGRISIYDIETEAMPELAYSQIKSGFKDYTYEKINGRGEFNTESQRSTVLNTDSVYNIVSEIRGDTIGITEKIQQPLTSEDSEEDNEVFIIKTQRWFGGDWQNELSTNVQIENNSSLFEQNTLNLYFTPLRMLLRHGNRIKGALLKNLDSYIRFQTSDKSQDLETSGEGVTIKENQDYLVNDLADAIYKPIKHTVTCKFTFADFEAIMLNKKGYITFSPTIKGYLLSLKKKNNEDKATIEIIEMVEPIYTD
jgi:hypothetical protein